MERHKEQVSTTVIAVRIESRISGKTGKPASLYVATVSLPKIGQVEMTTWIPRAGQEAMEHKGQAATIHYTRVEKDSGYTDYQLDSVQDYVIGSAPLVEDQPMSFEEMQGDGAKMPDPAPPWDDKQVVEASEQPEAVVPVQDNVDAPSTQPSVLNPIPRDVGIARSVALQQAIALAGVGTTKTKPKPEVIIKTAAVFLDFLLNGPTDAA